MRIGYLNGEEKTKTVFRVFRVYRVNEKCPKYPIYPKYPRYILKKIKEYSTWYRSGKDYTNDSKGISKGRESHSYHILMS